MVITYYTITRMPENTKPRTKVGEKRTNVYLHTVEGFAAKRRETAIAKAYARMEYHLSAYRELLTYMTTEYVINTSMMVDRYSPWIPIQYRETTGTKVHLSTLITKAKKDYYLAWWKLTRRFGEKVKNEVQEGRLIDLPRKPFYRMEFTKDQCLVMKAILSDRLNRLERFETCTKPAIFVMYRNRSTAVCQRLKRVQPIVTYYLTPVEAQTTTRLIRFAIKLLNTNRAMNEYLDGEVESVDHDWRAQKRDGKVNRKYEYVDIDTVCQARPLERLVTFWRGQMREDERAMLISIVESLQTKFAPT